jgi:hypothetical protein
MSEEIVKFIHTLGMFSEEDINAIEKIDDEILKSYKIWKMILTKKCADIFAKEKMEELKEQVLFEIDSKIEDLESKSICGYSNEIMILYEQEQQKLEELKEKRQQVEKMNYDELFDMITDKVFGSKTDMEFLLKQKNQREKQKLKALSYEGKKAYKDGQLDIKVLSKIFNEIKENNYIEFYKRVKQKIENDEELKNIRETKKYKKEIIEEKYIEIYDEKIKKQIEKIIEKIKSISNEPIKNYQDGDRINITRLENDIKKLKEKGLIGKIIGKIKGKKIDEVLSELETLKNNMTKVRNMKVRHQEIGFSLNKNMQDKLEKLQYSTDITFEKMFENRMKEIIEQEGTAINITQEEIDKTTNMFDKKIEEETNKITDKIRNSEKCTDEELEQIKKFAQLMDMKEKQAIELLNNDNEVYSALYLFVNGNQAYACIDETNAKPILTTINPNYSKINELDNLVNICFKNNTEIEYTGNTQKQLRIGSQKYNSNQLKMKK